MPCKWMRNVGCVKRGPCLAPHCNKSSGYASLVLETFDQMTAQDDAKSRNDLAVKKADLREKLKKIF